MDGTVAPELAAAAHEQFERKLRGVAYADYETEVITRHGRRVRAEISSVAIPGTSRNEPSSRLPGSSPSRACRWTPG